MGLSYEFITATSLATAIFTTHRLRRDVKGLESNVHTDHRVHAGDDVEDARANSLPSLNATQSEDDGPLVLWDDLDYLDEGEGEEEDDEDH